MRFRLAIQKAGLQHYFRKTAEDMDMETYFRRALPAADDDAVGRLMRWANWEKAHAMVATLRPAGELEATQVDMVALYALLVTSPDEDVAWNDLEESGLLHRSDMKHSSFEKRFSTCEKATHLSFKDFVEAVLMKYWHPLVATPSELRLLCSLGLDSLAAAKGFHLGPVYKSAYSSWRGTNGCRKLAPLDSSVVDRLHDFVEKHF